MDTNLIKRTLVTRTCLQICVGCMFICVHVHASYTHRFYLYLPLKCLQLKMCASYCSLVCLQFTLALEDTLCLTSFDVEFCCSYP